MHGLRRWREKRGASRQQGHRVSRHYYDIYKLTQSPVWQHGYMKCVVKNLLMVNLLLYFILPCALVLSGAAYGAVNSQSQPTRTNCNSQSGNAASCSSAPQTSPQSQHPQLQQNGNQLRQPAQPRIQSNHVKSPSIVQDRSSPCMQKCTGGSFNREAYCQTQCRNN
jgi:hypothetical protein